jgi:hypothetical protein
MLAEETGFGWQIFTTVLIGENSGAQQTVSISTPPNPL